jgi:translation elongation factor EF-Tu-like GTPase
MLATMHNVTRCSLLLIAALCGCRSETPPMPQPTFRFTVEEVFYIKPPVDSVILVGTVQDGTVKAGDPATVECKAGSVSVVVEGIEAFKQGDVKQATKGEQVGLKLRGITMDQPSKGDRVIGKSGG